MKVVRQASDPAMLKKKSYGNADKLHKTHYCMPNTAAVLNSCYLTILDPGTALEGLHLYKNGIGLLRVDNSVAWDK